MRQSTTSRRMEEYSIERLVFFARKAGYHYGWDWGPRLVTSGIWRPVLLEAWDDLRIENVFIRQKRFLINKPILVIL